MFKFLFLNVLFVFCFVSVAQAQDKCYTPLQAEAEQGIRIHSELMVIGLNCQHMGKRAGKNLYGDYRSFTAEHASLFSRYETVLMDFFKASGEAKPEAKLNELRTKYANSISQDVATMRPDVFCARYAPRVVRAAELSNESVRKWASTFYESYPVSYPVCKGL